MTKQERAARSRRLRLEVLSVLRSTETGVSGAIIWVAAGEFEHSSVHRGPRLLVVPGDSISAEHLTHPVTVLLTSPHDLLGALPPEVAGQVEGFVVQNRNALLRHWQGEADTRETLDLLVRVSP